jgi:type IV fimbrial biogenesis protein FimT
MTRHDRGFTLLELLVTLLVLAVVVGLGLPTVGRSADTIRSRAEVARFAAVLRRAREEAITSRQARDVVVDPGAGRVRIMAGPDQVREAWTLPGGLTVQAATPEALTVRFEAYGVSSGGEYRLTTGTSHWRVVVDPLTGRVRTTRE